MTDRIEKTITLKAPVSRVWRALTNAQEFGAWFGVNLTSAFAPGATVSGRITSAGYEHVTMEVTVERMEAERVFAYRWHPHAVDPDVDYSQEDTTLVEFTLEAVDGGTRLTVVESGFDRLPLARRELAFTMNDPGWAAQLVNFGTYVDA